MNARRVLHLMPWMLRLSMGGSLWGVIVLLTVLWVPFVAIRLWGAQSASVQVHFYSTLPAFLGLMAWRQQRHLRWSFLVSLPCTNRELVTAALLADAGVILFLTSYFPFPDIQGFATEIFGLWTVVMIGGWWSRQLWASIWAGLAAGFLGFLHSLGKVHEPLLLALTVGTALAATIVEFKIRSRVPGASVKLNGPLADAQAQGPTLRLPLSALRRTQIGMMLMADKNFAVWVPIYLISWLADAFARAALRPSPLLLWTLFIAISATAFVNGKVGEFIAVCPLPRARRFSAFAALAFICITAPGITRMLTVSTPDAASRKLQFVSFNKKGCSRLEAECKHKFASAINFHSGGPPFAFDVDVVSEQANGKAVYRPGPQAIAAFRRAILRGSIAITIQLAGMFIIGMLIAFYSNLTFNGRERRLDVWQTTALVVGGAGVVCEVFARDALPFPGAAFMTASALSAALITTRLAKLRFALP